MKTITKTIDLFTYDELSDEAKEKVKEWILSSDIRNDDFYETIKCDLEEDFPSSALKVRYSLAYCQGDGLNIYGDFNLLDFLPFWNTNEKEKRTIKFYINNSFSNYTFDQDNHYCYSCKFIDKKYMDDTINEFIDYLNYLNYKNINVDLIERFFYDFIDYFECLDKKYEKIGYDFLYDISNEDVSDMCEANEWMFTCDGKFYC